MKKPLVEGHDMRDVEEILEDLALSIEQAAGGDPVDIFILGAPADTPGPAVAVCAQIFYHEYDDAETFCVTLPIDDWPETNLDSIDSMHRDVFRRLVAPWLHRHGVEVALGSDEELAYEATVDSVTFDRSDWV